MSSSVSTRFDPTPDWLLDLLGVVRPDEGKSVEINGQEFVMRDGLLRSCALASEAQTQTGGSFGFKWSMRDTFESKTSLDRVRNWLHARYGDVAKVDWLAEHGESPILVDAGCGAGMSGLELFAPVLDSVRYCGVDVSEAVDVAHTRFMERGFPSAFMQADITNVPLPNESVDLIFSEGVLHHTDSTERTLKGLARKLKHGGRFLFYVYRRKGPIREFTDDYVRDKLQGMTPGRAWDAMKPLTRLGKILGDLDVEVDVPEDITLLGIPAGRISIHRLLYWHVFKAFHHPDMTFDELNHVNFDWYAPANAHRQSPKEVRKWCGEASLVIEQEVVEDAGITVIARKTLGCGAKQPSAE